MSEYKKSEWGKKKCATGFKSHFKCKLSGCQIHRAKGCQSREIWKKLNDRWLVSASMNKKKGKA